MPLMRKAGTFPFFATVAARAKKGNVPYDQ